MSPTAYEFRLLRNNLVGFVIEDEMSRLSRQGWAVQSLVSTDQNGHVLVLMQRELQDAPTPQDAS